MARPKQIGWSGYKIKAAPDVQTAELGSTVYYRLVYPESFTRDRIEELAPKLYWGVIYVGRGDQPECEPARRIRRRDAGWWQIWHDFKWKHVGHHIVYCSYKRHPIHGEIVATFSQHVDTMTAIRAAGLMRTRGQPLSDPIEKLRQTAKYITAIELIERHTVVPKEKQEKHKAELSRLQKYQGALESRLDYRLDDRRQILREFSYKPIRAVFTCAEPQRSRHADLTVCIYLRLGAKKDEAAVDLIDWTNPAVPELSGTYPGKGKDLNEAITAAVAVWQRHNKYNDGNIDFEVFALERGYFSGLPELHGAFRTPPAHWQRRLANILEYIALGAAGLAGVLTLIVPVPGLGPVMAGLIWTSIFTSTAAAVVRIADRHADGIRDMTADTIDTLNIVGNLFGAGQAKWAAGAILKGSLRGKLFRYAFYGEVLTQGVEGVLAAPGELEKAKEILDDLALTPKGRVDALLAWAGDNLRRGALFYVNVRSGKKAIQIDTQTAKRLRDPKQELVLEDRLRITGKTDAGKVKGKAYDNPTRKNNDEKLRPRARTSPVETTRKPKYKTTPLQDYYKGEDKGEGWLRNRGGIVQYLRSEKQRAGYELQVRDGKLYDAQGVPFDTRGCKNAIGEETGSAIFAMDGNGRIYAHKQPKMEKFHHSSFLAGEPVASAGEISVEAGVVKRANYSSGHYKPSELSNTQLKAELEARGMDTSQIDFAKGF